jgi:MFS family permease
VGVAAGETPFPSPEFRWFWAGEAVSALGSYVTLLALQTLVVLTLDGTAQDVGWLSSSRWLPYLVLGLVVGAWVDRWPRRPVMVGTDLVRAGLLCAIPVTWWAGVLTLPLLLVLVLAFGTASLVNDAASQSFVPRLVPPRHLQPAHARLDAGDAAAQTGGPALAGGLVTLVGAPVAVLVDAVTYLFSAAVVLRLRGTEAPRARARERPRHLRDEVVEGIRWVYGRSGLARLALSTHVWFAGQAALGVVVAPYALLVLGLTPFQLGLATALAGVGAALGAVVTGAVGRGVGTGGAIIGAHLLSALGALTMAGAGLVGSGREWVVVAVLATGQLLHGTGMGISNSHEMSVRQLLTPDELQARTNTTMRSLNRAVVVVGAPLSGLLADSWGTGTVLVAAAAVFATSAGMLLASPFRVDRSTVAVGQRTRGG